MIRISDTPIVNWLSGKLRKAIKNIFTVPAKTRPSLNFM